MHPPARRPAVTRPSLRSAVAAALLAGAALAAGCAPSATPPASFVPGTGTAPREVNLIAVDYAFLPPALVVVAGETLLIHLVNAGLEPHEAVIGDADLQLAWETAEAAVADHPPGPTPVVSVPPGLGGIRVFVASGQRVDVRWTVPDQPVPGPGASAAPPWFVGCHIPGHFAKGMVIPLEFAQAQAAAVPAG